MSTSFRNCHTSPWMLSRSNDVLDEAENIRILLRPEDSIKVVIKLENTNKKLPSARYLVIVSTSDTQNREECALLGVDVVDRIPTIGLVLPIDNSFTVQLVGDGDFTVTTKVRSSPYLFKPTSVQSMWSALQCMCLILQKENSVGVSEQRFEWTLYYKSPTLASGRLCVNEWNKLQELQVSKSDRIRWNLPPDETEIVNNIRLRIRNIMRNTPDLTLLTCKEVRLTLEKSMNMDLTKYRNIISEDMIIVMGQMDSPSKIFDNLYLGSEFNASNFDELKQNRVGSIVNVTVEVDNFFPEMFDYYNVRVLDEETTKLMKHWHSTYEFISQAWRKNVAVLVHCRMGISRSASTVIAFAMKHFGWSLDKAFEYVHARRPIVKPNPGFMNQLVVYESILKANKKYCRKMGLLRNRANSVDDLDSMKTVDSDDTEQPSDRVCEVPATDVVNISPGDAASQSASAANPTSSMMEYSQQPRNVDSHRRRSRATSWCRSISLSPTRRFSVRTRQPAVAEVSCQTEFVLFLTPTDAWTDVCSEA